MTALSTIPETICTEIRQQLPGLASCKPYAGKLDLKELKEVGAATPAVLVGSLGAREAERASGGYTAFNLSFSAYVITRNAMGLDRDTAAANICTVLLGLVPGANWDEASAGGATDVRLHTLNTVETRSAGIALWAVTWSQPMTFYLRDTGEPVALQTYVGLEPNTGPDALQAYEQIGAGQ